MPLTDLQKRILKAVAANRDPENYVAGGAVLNVNTDRFSDDIDLFSDRMEDLDRVAGWDEKSLRQAGLSVQWHRRNDTFRRAVVGMDQDSTRMDWSFDSDYRFFPTEKDEIFGYRLHAVDQATNKIIAAIDRSETRDILDLKTISEDILPLGPVAWAAAEKSPGRSPDMIIQELRRKAALRQEQIDEENLIRMVDAGDLNNWLREDCDRAQKWIGSIPPQFDFGLFVDPQGTPCAPDFEYDDPGNYRIHTGARTGAWPTSPEISSEMIRTSVANDDDEGEEFGSDTKPAVE